MKNAGIIAAASVAAIGVGFVATEDVSAQRSNEKCYGIVKAGQNDCGNHIHSCSGQATSDRLRSEWIYLPAGLCRRIAGGSTNPG